ncbi:THAP domain-containing protein 1-like [Aphis craccivora]|uniref:THAP domain-containing protein 1-like n=1 Tax=Aphis craccivora TaxID=307492 RepID=A0A6G0W4S2_APHCR|nr:THAP domain-containing protein 1-like [Aphis craccivora]
MLNIHRDIEISTDAVLDELSKSSRRINRKQQFPELGSTTTQYNAAQNENGHDYTMPSWINHLFYGGLIVPSYNFRTHIFRIERLLNKITKQQILKGPKVVKNLSKKIIERMEIEEKYKPVVQTYVKQRILIRMKYLNQNTNILNKKRKAKLQLQRLQKLKRLMT